MRQLFQWTVLLAASVAVQAQVPIAGSVVDPQGRPVDGAELSLFAEGRTSAVGKTRTQSGRFTFVEAGSGRFLLEVAAVGFRRETVVVDTGAGAPLVVKLRLAGLDQRVLVTAEASAQTIDQVSKAASVIDAEEIAQRDEYSLSEALRDTPGLLVRNLGGPGQLTSIRMRGLRADATAVLIDGLRFRDVATIQADASSFLSTMNVINLDRVEVLRGTGSSLYGTNAVGGTVNVVTRSGGGPPRGSVQFEGGSLGLVRGLASVSGGWLGDRLAYSAGLLHLNVMSGVDGDDRARSSGVQSFVRYTLGPRTSVSARLFASDDFVQNNNSPTSAGLPAANIPSTGNVPAIPLAPEQVRNSLLGLPIQAGNATFIPNRDDPDNRRASRFWNTALVLRQTLTPWAQAQISYQHLTTNRTFQNGPAGVGFQPKVSNFSQFQGGIDTVDARVSAQPRRWLALTAGYEFEREDYRNADDNRLPAPATVSTVTRANQRSNAAYVASQWTALGQRLQLSLSGRAQGFAVDRPHFELTGVANNYDSVALAAPPRALTADAAVSYFLPATGTKLRAHGGNAYRAPGLYERYGSGFFLNPATGLTGFTPYGDPRLSPDRYNSVDGGIDQYLLRDRLRLSGTWFYTRIVQITQFDSAGTAIVAGRDPFGRTSGYFNGAGGTSRGAELTGEFRVSPKTLLRASYSYVNADTDQDTAVRGFFGALSVPPHSVTAMVHQQLGRKSDVTMDLYRSSDYYNSLFAGGRARAYLYPGVTKMDIVAGREMWSDEKHAVRLFVKVDHLVGNAYYENGFLAPGRTFLTGLKLLFR